MAREDLMLDLNSVIRQAIATGKPARKTGIRLKREGRQHVIAIGAIPVLPDAELERYYLVVFEDVTECHAQLAATAEAAGKKSDDKQVAELQQELAITREYLQSVIEQQETGNEELRSANEEIQSSNEELQSINEELETAKEELQSANEELATVNEELESRNLELNQVNNDLTNLIASINIPLVILSLDLRIRRFSPGAEKLLNLGQGDIGGLISDIKPDIIVDGLTTTISEVIETLQPHETDARDKDGRWYSVRVHPYKTTDNRIDGAVVVYVDVDDMKRSLEAASHARDYAEAIIAAVRHPMLVLDGQLSVISASAAFYDTFQVTSKDTVGNLLYRLGNGQWGIPELRHRLDTTVRTGEAFDDFIVEHDFENIGRKTMSVSGRVIPAIADRETMVLMQIEDLTGKGLHF
jgi:two-component system CheB/CheR fusion protein